MWKDENLAIPNKAARRLFHPSADFTDIKDGLDLVSKWNSHQQSWINQQAIHNSAPKETFPLR
jgi:hypothetical protein